MSDLWQNPRIERCGNHWCVETFRGMQFFSKCYGTWERAVWAASTFVRWNAKHSKPVRYALAIVLLLACSNLLAQSKGQTVPSGWAEMPRSNMCVGVNKDGKYINRPCQVDENKNEVFYNLGDNIITDHIFMATPPEPSVIINWGIGAFGAEGDTPATFNSLEIKDKDGKELLSCGWESKTKHVKDCKLENDASLESAMDAMVQAFKGTYEGNLK